jgi:hypothetical protein
MQIGNLRDGLYAGLAGDFFAFRQLEFSQENANFQLAGPEYMHCPNPTESERLLPQLVNIYKLKAFIF